MQAKPRFALLSPEAIAPDETHRRAAAGVAEQRQAVDGDAGRADLLKHRPQRLGHSLEMGGVKRTGQCDREAVLAEHERIAEALQEKALIVAEMRACMLHALGVARKSGEILER